MSAVLTAEEATVKEIHDAPAVRGSIIANMLQEHDNPFTLYPYDTCRLYPSYPADSEVCVSLSCHHIH